MAILVIVLTVAGTRQGAGAIPEHYRISMTKCQLNLPRWGHWIAPAPPGGNGEVAVALAKMGGQAAGAD
jgi:hypothetical protein